MLGIDFYPDVFSRQNGIVKNMALYRKIFNAKQYTKYLDNMTMKANAIAFDIFLVIHQCQ